MGSCSWRGIPTAQGDHPNLDKSSLTDTRCNYQSTHRNFTECCPNELIEPAGAQKKKFMERKWSFDAEIDVLMDTHKENTQLKHTVKTLDASKALRILRGGQSAAREQSAMGVNVSTQSVICED